MVKILIVEDEEAIASLIEETLLDEGYECDVAYNGADGADLVEENSYDLALLDIMMPEINGYELFEYIAPTGTPVIFLTAKASIDDRVKGLKMGADDYIIKPFEARELVARVETVLRRTGKGNNVLTAFNVELDTAAKLVKQNGKEVHLSPKEFAVLEILMRNRGIALYRDVLFEKAWGDEFSDNTRALDLTILRLRKKLSWNSEIRTVLKIGYMLEK